MSLSSHICGVALHQPEGEPIINGDVAFGQCRRCGKEIIRKQSRFWGTVPQGMRIVWRVPEGNELTWPIQKV